MMKLILHGGFTHTFSQNATYIRRLGAAKASPTLASTAILSQLRSCCAAYTKKFQQQLLTQSKPKRREKRMRFGV